MTHLTTDAATAATDPAGVRVIDDRLALGPVTVTFHRTLRIPESGLHPLPPSLGRFRVRRVADHPDTVPPAWLEHGGVMLPMFRREALWLGFEAAEPAALQVATGKVCAVSGKPWDDRLHADPQNYLTLPDQPWLDGINAGDGFVRQFVAVPLGLGASVEAQVTGEEQVGGIQLRAVGLTEEALAEWHSGDPEPEVMACMAPASPPAAGAAMGLGVGGRMRQEVYVDERPLCDYDEQRSWRVFVHLCSAEQWTAITGELPPPSLIDRETYVRHGLPWFDHYDADHDDLAASDALRHVRSVGTVLGEIEPPFTPVAPWSVVPLTPPHGDAVDPGEW